MPEITETLAVAVRHHRAGNLLRAEGMYREVLRRQPNHPDALHMLGVLARQTGRAELALESIAKAVALNTANPAFYFSLANTLRQKGNLDQAIAHYQRALQLDPNFADAYLQLGATLQEQGRVVEALESLEHGLALDPHDAQARTSRGMILLALGNFQQGWREFEWRWVDRRGSALPWQPCPFWDGSPLDESTLLVQAEKSLSDQIMFASCLPDVIAKAKHCIVECHPALATLFSRSFPAATIRAICRTNHGNPSPQRELARPDVRIAAGSLPRYLRPDLLSFPRHAGYLAVEPQRRQQLWARLESLGPGLKIGIAWRGSRGEHATPQATDLADWTLVLKTPGVHFVSLQPGDCTAELLELRRQAGIKIHAWPDVFADADFDALTALIAALDLVIAAPNHVAHLAGALGVECWTLLAHWSSWRWFVGRGDSPWYPSMRLFRQSQPGNWPGVMDRVEQALRVRASSETSC